MKWNIPDIPEAEEVFRPIYKWYCLVALTMLYILVAILLWFTEDSTLIQKALYLCLPLLIVGIFFLSIRIHKQYQKEAWAEEKKHIESRWKQWANKKIALLRNGIYLPQEISIDGILNDTGGTFHNEVFYLPEDTFKRAIWECLESLDELLQGTLLTNIRFYIDSDNYQYKKDCFDYLKKTANLFQNIIKNDLLWVQENNGNIIDSWMEDMADGLHVLISPAINNSSSAEGHFTENIIWFIFSNEKSVEDKKIHIKNYISRGLNIDSTNKAEVSSNLEKFLRYSDVENRTIQYWIDSYSFLTLEKYELLPYLFSLKTKNIKKSVEKYLGSSPLNMNWLLIALTTKNLHSKNDIVIVIYSSDSEYEMNLNIIST